MAKRAKDTEPYRPLQASLLSDVLNGARAEASPVSPAAPAVVPTKEPPEAREKPVQLPASPPAPRWENSQRSVVPEKDDRLAFEQVERLTREKRVMLSVTEEEKVEDLVRALAKELRTPVKLSHLLRASLSLLLRSREELLQQAQAKQVERPSNGDAAGLLKFERELCSLLDGALRLTRPPGKV